jgi:hypothetical protein
MTAALHERRTAGAPAPEALEMSRCDDPLRAALDEVSARSSGGAPFLFAFAGSLLICAVLGFVLPLETAALILMFQGNVALPVALFLERRMGTRRMAKDNPLRPLSVQLALSQVLALPAAFLAYSYHPALVPAALAAIVGCHFLPYAWLQRTRAYAVLAVAVSIGAYALTMVLKRGAFSWVVLYMAALYVVFGAIVRARAARHVRAAGAVAP